MAETLVRFLGSLSHWRPALYHIAEPIEGGGYYLWCWGASQVVKEANDPTAQATCLQCIAQGPYGPWVFNEDLQRYVRTKMSAGQAILEAQRIGT